MLIDGGVISNNLSDITYHNAKKLFGPGEKFFQLSIGTGRYLPKITYVPSGLWGWLGLFGVLFSASANYRMGKLLDKPKIPSQSGFFRLDIPLSQDIVLDNYNEFPNMKLIFANWLVHNKCKLDELCNELLIEDDYNV